MLRRIFNIDMQLINLDNFCIHITLFGTICFTVSTPLLTFTLSLVLIKITINTHKCILIFGSNIKVSCTERKIKKI